MERGFTKLKLNICSFVVKAGKSAAALEQIIFPRVLLLLDSACSIRVSARCLCCACLFCQIVRGVVTTHIVALTLAVRKYGMYTVLYCDQSSKNGHSCLLAVWRNGIELRFLHLQLQLTACSFARQKRRPRKLIPIEYTLNKVTI